MKQLSLLDELARRAGCELLSDLRRSAYRGQMYTEVQSIPAAAYPLAEWNDAAHYLDNQTAPFSAADEARAHLLGILRDPQGA